MKLYPFCDPYVWENVKVLLKTGFVVKAHKDGKCVSEYVNTIVLIFLLAFMAGLLISLIAKVSYAMALCLGFATLYSLPIIFELIQLSSKREGFKDATIIEEIKPTYNVIGAANSTMPNSKNPFMNVLIDEIKYNPTRPKADSVLDPSVKIHLDDFFRTEFYSDPTDVFGRSQSQREFITMPSTTIPNDQESYQNWLYRIPGKTCKEGGREACLPGTDGGAIPWLNIQPS